MIRRVVGLVFILLGVSGLAMCYLGARAGRDLIDNVASSADQALDTANETLATVEDSLEQARETLQSISGTIGQVHMTTSNLALTVDDTQPALDQLANLVGDDIPATIGDVQAAIPNIAQTAKVVDDTLRFLSKLQVEQTIPIINYRISFGLGVEYDPEVPFDQAVEQVGAGLEPIATASGNLETNLRTATTNMAILVQDLEDLSEELDGLNEEVAAFRPLLDEYSTLVEDMQTGISDGRQQLADQFSMVKKGIVLVAVWLSLFQLLPFYFGLELASGSRMVRVDELRPLDLRSSGQLQVPNAQDAMEKKPAVEVQKDTIPVVGDGDQMD